VLPLQFSCAANRLIILVSSSGSLSTSACLSLGITLETRIGSWHGHGIILGPFHKLGPLVDTDIANIVGLVATIGLVYDHELSHMLIVIQSNPIVTKHYAQVSRCF